MGALDQEMAERTKRREPESCVVGVMEKKLN